MITSNKVSFAQPLPLRHANKPVESNLIQARTHLTWFGGYFRVPQNFVLAQATDVHSIFKVYPEIIIDSAEKQAFQQNQASMVIGKKIADRYDWKIGQSIPLSSNVHTRSNGSRVWNFEIVGIFETPDNPTLNNYAFFHYDYLNIARAYQQNKVTQLVWLLTDTQKLRMASSLIDDVYALTAQPTKTTPESQYADYFLSQIEGVKTIISLFVAGSIISIMLMITSSLVLNVKARTKDIAIIKSIGFNSHRIVIGLDLQAFLFILIGGGLGIVMAYLVIQHLAASGILVGATVSFPLILIALCSMLLLSTLSTTLPASLIYKIKVAEAMRKTQL